MPINKKRPPKGVFSISVRIRGGHRHHLLLRNSCVLAACHLELL